MIAYIQNEEVREYENVLVLCYHCNKYGINMAKDFLDFTCTEFDNIDCIECGRSTQRHKTPGLTMLEHQLAYLDPRRSIDLYCSKFSIAI